MEINHELEQVISEIFGSFDRSAFDGSPNGSVPTSILAAREYSRIALITANLPIFDNLKTPDPEQAEALLALQGQLQQVQDSAQRALLSF